MADITTFVKSGLVALAVAGAALAVTPVAWAGEGQDIVYLVNGGRVRGTVFMEDPVNGVTVKLIDGTTRTIPKAEVARVQYGPEAAAPAPAPAAPAAPGAPLPGYGPAPGAPAYGQPGAPTYTGTGAPGYGPPATGYGGGDVPKARQRRSTGLMVTGIVLMGGGAGAMAAGGALVGVAGSDDSCGEYYDYDYESGYYETDFSGCGTDEGMQTAGIGLLIGGGSSIAVGLFFTIFGASKHGGAAASASAPEAPLAEPSPVPEIHVGLGSAQLRWAF